MALTIVEQILLNFNIFNHFKVVKCLQITKQNIYIKLNKVEKGYFMPSFLWLFRKRVSSDKKRMHAQEITQIVQSRKLIDEDIYLTMV